MWKEENNSLIAHLEFKNFVAALEYMQACVAAIEEANHHPEWTNNYNKLSIKLTTHDAGNIITTKDRKLAVVLEEIYCQLV